MRNIIIISSAFILIIISTFVVSSFTNGGAVFKDGSVHLHKPIILPLKTDILKKNTLLFLGYVGCPDICTPRMQEILNIYNAYNKKSENQDLNVLFISLNHNESKDLSNTFAKSFDDNFIGTTATKKQMQKLARTLNAYYSRSLTNENTIDHTESLYLIKKEKDGTTYIENIYMQSPYNTNMIVNDLIKDK